MYDPTLALILTIIAFGLLVSSASYIYIPRIVPFLQLRIAKKAVRVEDVGIPMATYVSSSLDIQSEPVEEEEEPDPIPLYQAEAEIRGRNRSDIPLRERHLNIQKTDALTLEDVQAMPYDFVDTSNRYHTKDLDALLTSEMSEEEIFRVREYWGAPIVVVNEENIKIADEPTEVLAVPQEAPVEEEDGDVVYILPDDEEHVELKEGEEFEAHPEEVQYVLLKRPGEPAPWHQPRPIGLANNPNSMETWLKNYSQRKQRVRKSQASARKQREEHAG